MNASGMPRKALERPILGIFAAPFLRIWESPLYAKLLAGVYGLAGLIRSDILFWVLLSLFVATLWDTLLGRAAAVSRSEKIDPDIARAGYLTKVTGFVLIGLVRMTEQWGMEHQIPGLELTHGALAAGVTVALLLMEVESIEANRVELGARPIPAISAFIRSMRVVEGRLLAMLAPQDGGGSTSSDPEVQQ